MKLIAKQLVLLGITAALLALFIILKPHTFNTALADLIPSTNPAVTQLSQKYANTLTLILEGPNFESVKNAAQTIKNQNTQLKTSENLPNFKDLIKTFSEHKHSFVSEKDAILIQTNPSKITQNALSDLTFSWVPPLTSVNQDPFLLIHHYLTGLKLPTTTWQTKNGFLFQNQKDKTYLLINFFLSQQKMPQLIQTLENLQKTLLQLPPEIKPHLSGIPLHSAYMYQKTSNQILLFSSLALLALLGLSILLFHKKTLVFSTLLNLAFAFTVGTLFLWIMTNEIHLMTFVFAASLVGICVDYSFHGFTSNTTNKSMFYSFLTTLFVLFPLLFSPLPLLKQIALFVIGGLCGTYLQIRLITPNTKTMQVPLQRKLPLKKYCNLCVLSILLLTLFIPQLAIKNTPQSLYNPSTELAAQENFAHELSPYTTSYFLITQADSLQKALETEESVRKNHNFVGLSTILPSTTKQQGNQELIKSLYQNQATNIQKTLHLKHLPKFKPTPPLTEKELFEKYPVIKELFLVQNENQFFLIAPLTQNIDTSPSDTFVFTPSKNLTNQLNTYAKNTYKSLMISALLLLCLLAILYHKNCIFYLLPTLMAICCMLGMFALFQWPITFFHLISLFIVIGLGLDYTIFHINHSNKTIKKTVLFSFLSSFIGFGLLAFTTFMPVAIMGQTIAIGLALSYLFSHLLFNQNRQ